MGDGPDGGVDALTFEEIDTVLRKITYKPGWKLSWELMRTYSVVLMISADIEDSFNPGQMGKIGFREPLPRCQSIANRDHLLQLVRAVLGKIELHERDEWLKIDGIVIFDPHAT